MGQPVQVHEKVSVAVPGVVRYETNRPLSGMGHRYYHSAADALSVDDPADELAKRLFERGGIRSVHVQGSVVTVELAEGQGTEGIIEIIESLFTYYVEG
jgi:hypothetical protein